MALEEFHHVRVIAGAAGLDLERDEARKSMTGIRRTAGVRSSKVGNR